MSKADVRLNMFLFPLRALSFRQRLAESRRYPSEHELSASRTRILSKASCKCADCSFARNSVYDQTRRSIGSPPPVPWLGEGQNSLDGPAA